MVEQRDLLDKALDDALASYSEAPENEGLERRILARVTKTAGHPRRPLAMAVGVAAAGITVCLFLWVTAKMTVQTLPASTTILALRKIEAPRIQTIPVPEPATFLASAAKPRRLRKRSTEPKLSQFPTPSPLSSKERALVQLVTHNAKDIPRELAYLSSPVKPIHITEIEIKPIQLESYTKEKRCCDQ